MTGKQSLLQIRGLKKYFPIYGGLFRREVARVHAVDGVDLDVQEGQTLGIVGESGCGKSTLGRTLLKLHSITSGQVIYQGKDISDLSPKQMRPLRRDLQIVFQDPNFSLNPKHDVRKILMEPLILHKIGWNDEERLEMVKRILTVVGLRESHLDRYPHEFSGGQRQRLGIARCLLLKPKLIVADEPVSALDVSIQSQILNLLKDLQRDFGLTYVFISHDLAVVEFISTHVAVMYLGQIVEYTTRENLFKSPSHPYTKALISAIPVPDPDRKVERIILQGDVPSPINPPSGCRFHPRCPFVKPECKSRMPELKEIAGSAHRVRCHLFN